MFSKLRKTKQNIILGIEVIIKQDRQQQTSLVSSRRSSTHEEKYIYQFFFEKHNLKGVLKYRGRNSPPPGRDRHRRENKVYYGIPVKHDWT
jgi:hypothetical protein